MPAMAMEATVMDMEAMDMATDMYMAMVTVMVMDTDIMDNLTIFLIDA